MSAKWAKGTAGPAGPAGDEHHNLIAVPDVTHSLRGEGFDASEDGTGRGTPLAPVYAPDCAHSIVSNGDAHSGFRDEHGLISHAMRVRRLTPRECERLQGFPDDYTFTPIRHYKKRTVSKNRPAWRWQKAAGGGWWLMETDSARYKALGNSWAVPCAHWIGERINLVNQISTEHSEAA